MLAAKESLVTPSPSQRQRLDDACYNMQQLVEYYEQYAIDPWPVIRVVLRPWFVPLAMYREELS